MRFQLAAIATATAGVAIALPQNNSGSSKADIVDALKGKGVDVKSVPGLAELVEKPSANECSIACSALKSSFGADNVALEDEESYKKSLTSYWSAQESDIKPHCIFKPSKSDEVAAAVLLAQLTQCPFATKGGGHQPAANMANIQGGVTIMMERFKDLKVADDKKTATIGAGLTWEEVYVQLEKQKLGAPGGRFGAIGVPGLTLGGGISYFANIVGWTCDNIASYEIVTASGEVVTAKFDSEYSDLYWALRGGSNNFGIVTKFDFEVFPLGGMWGGGKQYAESDFPAVIDAFTNLGLNAADDPNAAEEVNFLYVGGMKIGNIQLNYAKPVANASIFEDFNAITPMVDSTRFVSLPDRVTEFESPVGSRQSMWSSTFKLTKETATFVLDIFYEEAIALGEDVPGIVSYASIQPITIPQLEKMSRNGGNPIPLTVKEGPYLLLTLTATWSDAADDPRVIEANKKVLERTKEKAKKEGTDVDYIYMNYASSPQKVMANYGESLSKLKQVSKKYDPEGVFQKLHPGGFKLDG